MSQTVRDPDTSPDSVSCGGGAQGVHDAAEDGSNPMAPSLEQRLGARLGPVVTTVARDAYTPEGVDRAAIFVPPSPQADTA